MTPVVLENGRVWAEEKLAGALVQRIELLNDLDEARNALDDAIEIGVSEDIVRASARVHQIAMRLQEVDAEIDKFAKVLADLDEREQALSA
ncbi:MAG: hypothetical protein K6T83_03715 [Alicyclobacillus sp.]|nr:hypothetical protein [Alicyclobacillus sp.]